MGPSDPLEIFPTLVVNFRFISIFFFTDFLMWGVLKLLLNLLLLFYVLGCFFFFPLLAVRQSRILTPDQEWDPTPPAVEDEVATTGPSWKFLTPRLESDIASSQEHIKIHSG